MNETPMFTGSKVDAISVEPDNTYYGSVALSEATGWREGGLKRAGLTPKTVARFWSKVQHTPTCWLWIAGTFKTGYGMFNAGRFADGKQDTRYAHRVAFQLLKGEIPGDREIMHGCDVRRCVNPNHLNLGTSADNVHDAVKKGRMYVEHPNAQTFSRSIVHEAMNGPRGTIARLAREHGLSLQALYMAVMRARQRQAQKVA